MDIYNPKKKQETQQKQENRNEVNKDGIPF